MPDMDAKPMTPNAIAQRLFAAGLDTVGAKPHRKGTPPNFNRLMAAGSLKAWTALLTPPLSPEEMQRLSEIRTGHSIDDIPFLCSLIDRLTGGAE